MWGESQGSQLLLYSSIVSGKFFGVAKIVVMIGLTAGYAWFTFFQPPVVFSGLGMYVD